MQTPDPDRPFSVREALALIGLAAVLLLLRWLRVI
jgi:hypothetical protein